MSTENRKINEGKERVQEEKENSPQRKEGFTFIFFFYGPFNVRLSLGGRLPFSLSLSLNGFYSD